MAWLEQLPGMEPGHSVRNLAVGVGYLVAVLIAIVLLPVLALGAVATNYRGIATRLSRLPGIERDGGLKAGVVAGAYVFVLWSVLLAGANAGILGSGSGPGASDDGRNEGAADAVSSDEEGELSDGEIIVLFETVVERRGVEIVSAEKDGDVFRVEFYQTATNETEFLERAGAISGAYVGAVGEGLGTERMEVTALDEDDESPVLSWYVDSEWARAYHSGEFTMDEVIERSLATTEAIDVDDTNDAVDDVAENGSDDSEPADAAGEEGTAGPDETGGRDGTGANETDDTNDSAETGAGADSENGE